MGVGRGREVPCACVGEDRKLKLTSAFTHMKCVSW